MSCYPGETLPSELDPIAWHVFESFWDAQTGQSSITQLCRECTSAMTRLHYPVPALTWPYFGSISSPTDGLIANLGMNTLPGRNNPRVFKETLEKLDFYLKAITANTGIEGQTGYIDDEGKKWYYSPIATLIAVRAAYLSAISGKNFGRMEDWEPIVIAMRVLLDALNAMTLKSHPWTEVLLYVRPIIMSYTPGGVSHGNDGGEWEEYLGPPLPPFPFPFWDGYWILEGDVSSIETVWPGPSPPAWKIATLSDHVYPGVSGVEVDGSLVVADYIESPHLWFRFDLGEPVQGTPTVGQPISVWAYEDQNPLDISVGWWSRRKLNVQWGIVLTTTPPGHGNAIPGNFPGGVADGVLAIGCVPALKFETLSAVMTPAGAIVTFDNSSPANWRPVTFEWIASLLDPTAKVGFGGGAIAESTGCGSDDIQVNVSMPTVNVCVDANGAVHF